MWRWVGGEPSQSDDSFERLAEMAISLPIASTPSADNATPPKKRLESNVVFDRPSARRLRSAYLTEENMGELVNFALFPREYDAQVFHLHGRVDAPESMVLSQRDYRNTYLKSGTSEELFETAVGAIFAANDVLFVGIGLNEPDPMRPLRKVMAQSWDRDLARRHIVAMLPFESGTLATYFRKYIDKLLESRKPIRLQQIEWIIGQLTSPSGANILDKFQTVRSAAEAENAKRTIGNFEKYGVFTIAYGGHELARRLLWLEAAVKIRRNFDFTKYFGDSPALSEVRNEKPKKPLDKTKSRSVAAYKEQVRAAILTQALTDELERIAKSRDSWFKDWRERPDSRHSTFAGYILPPDHNSRSDESNPKPHPLPTQTNYSRHRTVYHPYWSDYHASGKKEFKYDDAGNETIEGIKDVFSERKKSWSSFRLARVVIRRGGGKGALLHLLQSRDPTADRPVLDRFHPDANDPSIRYSSSFVVNLSYSIEFASIIDALIAFFDPQSAQSQNNSDPPVEHRVLALRKAMEKASDEQGRRFICISGVDRLCDARGLIPNGMYRRFFSTLTGKGLPSNDNWHVTLKQLNLDVLLISGREDRPPRYMSDEKTRQEMEWPLQKLDRSEWLPVTGSDLFLRRWRVVPSFSAKDCYWLDPRKQDAISAHPKLNEWLGGKVAATTWCAKAFPLDQSKWQSYVNLVWGAVRRDGIHGLIRTVIEAYREQCPKDFPLAASCLRHLALYPIPVERSVLMSCPDLATHKRHKVDRVLKELFQRGLVIRIRARQQPFESKCTRMKWDIRQFRYTLHHQLREYIARRNDLISPDHGDQFDFQVTLFCHQPIDIPSPKPQHFEWVQGIVEAQLRHCREVLGHLHQIEKYSGSIPKQPEALDSFSKEHPNRREAILSTPQKLRSIYAMLRGSFTLGAMLRLDEDFARASDIEPLDRMKGWLRGITNAATSLSKVRGVFDQSKNSSPLLNVHPVNIPDPFYRDEIGWLINERGVIALTQGYVYDALPLFDNALEVMGHKMTDENGPDRHDPAYHASERRILLNRAVTLLDHGNLDRADSELRKLILPQVPGRHLGSQVGWIAEGYLGLVKHLQGDLDGAKLGYEKVIQRAAEQGMLRVVSIFAKHSADLHRRLLLPEEAKRMAVRAVDAAQNSEQRDLVWMARLAQVRMWVEGIAKADIQPLRITEGAIRYADVMNLARLRSEAMRLRAECLLKNGDAVTAGKAAMEAAAAANRAGLRLMKVAATVVFARSLQMRGRNDDARTVFQASLREARRRRFELYVGDIQSLMEGV